MSSVSTVCGVFGSGVWGGRGAIAMVAAIVVVMVMMVSEFVTTASPPGGEPVRAGCGDEVRTPSTVVLHLADRVGLARDAREEMMRETTDLWRAAGVDVQWAAVPHGTLTTGGGPTGAGTTGTVATGAVATGAVTTTGTGTTPERDTALESHPRVYVIVTRDVAEDLLRTAAATRRPLASILFVDAKPTTLIRAYPLEVERLLDVARLDDESFAHRPPRMRYRLVGRVLGRAVAHELGHFLFASAEHTPTGLMRASHRTDFLLGSSTRAFHVVAPRSSLCVVTDTELP